MLSVALAIACVAACAHAYVHSDRESWAFAGMLAVIFGCNVFVAQTESTTMTWWMAKRAAMTLQAFALPVGCAAVLLMVKPARWILGGALACLVAGAALLIQRETFDLQMWDRAATVACIGIVSAWGVRSWRVGMPKSTPVILAAMALVVFDALGVLVELAAGTSYGSAITWVRRGTVFSGVLLFFAALVVWPWMGGRHSG